MDLQPGKIAIVTGAASGIGLALAREAASAGMQVVMADVQGDALTAAAEALRVDGGVIEAIHADVSDPPQIDRVVRAAFDSGTVQLVCSNAGIVRAGRSWEITDDTWQQVMATNFMATVHLFRAVMPGLIARGEPAHFLVTGSMASVTARPGISPYVAAKHALLGLCEATNHELAAAGLPIGVTLLMPGQVITGMTAAAPAPGAISAREVARMAMEAVAADQLFCFTQADRIPEVERRFAAIIAQSTPEPPG